MRTADVGGGPKTLYWYVMPCGGVVNVEIRCKKKMLVRKRVFGYEKIVVDDVGFGERYLLKVETVSADETQRVGSVEVGKKKKRKYYFFQFMRAQSVSAFLALWVAIRWWVAEPFGFLLFAFYFTAFRKVKPRGSRSV